jgi:hypothetical protein
VKPAMETKLAGVKILDFGIERSLETGWFGSRAITTG